MSGPFSSEYVGTKAAQTLYYAAEEGDRIDQPLNTVATINFAATPIEPWNAPAAFARLRNVRFAPWCRRPGRERRELACEPTYAYAFENVRDGVAFATMAAGEPHNVHVHWHVHIPPERKHEFEQIVWTWVEEVAGACEPNAIHISERKSVGYLNKGARKRDVEIYARGQDAVPQGVILGGRRTGTTVNIGPSARRARDRADGIRRQLPNIKGVPFYRKAKPA